MICALLCKRNRKTDDYATALPPLQLGTDLTLQSGSPAFAKGIDPSTLSGLPAVIVSDLKKLHLYRYQRQTRPQGKPSRDSKRGRNDPTQQEQEAALGVQRAAWVRLEAVLINCRKIEGILSKSADLSRKYGSQAFVAVLRTREVRVDQYLKPRVGAPDGSEYVEPRTSGHLQIQDNRIGIALLDRDDRLRRVARLADNLYAGNIFQEVRQSLNDDLRVVSDKHPHFLPFSRGPFLHLFVEDDKSTREYIR